MANLQFSSVTQSCRTLCNPMDCSMPGFPVHHQLLEFTQTLVRWVSDAIQPFILCCPLLLLPSVFPSIRVFSNESVLCIRLIFSFTYLHLKLLEFNIDWGFFIWWSKSLDSFILALLKLFKAPYDYMTLSSWNSFFLFFGCTACGGLSSLTKDWTHAPCSGSTEF